ncbi:hypothetical protein [Hyphomicrobium sp. D-2]|uniref:hypothetical protein n=1 Tax=Hyphomicrobium sp. D-2 TaxID=3041621 RepID=UPI0024540C9F|nr:hypothetical protein [Hyphomicrobium sp. D-2]MDH4982806.1 hypothetical protein [Hyphomicrobium sp. D-2]
MSAADVRWPTAAAALILAASSFAADAQTARRDGIAELLRLAETGADKSPASAQAPPQTPGNAQAQPKQPADPREGDKAFEQARRLMREIDSVLRDAADHRAQAQKLPGRDEFILTPLWTETREDREARIRGLLDSALGIVTDVPVVEMQRKIETLRLNIRDIETQIATMKEKQLTAPKDAMLPGLLTDTVDSLEGNIQDAHKRIDKNREEIAKAKTEVAVALAEAGVQLSPDQVDLLLDSVLSGDLVRLVAAFSAAKVIDSQLGKLLNAAGDNMNAARKYFAMHAALFAMLVHAQSSAIERIDTNYMPKLDAILKDIATAQGKTARLLQAENRPDQRRALEANREAQKVAAEAAKAYRRYLQQQREQIACARTRAVHDLRIADNTYETVEASFQLKNLMQDSAASFEAIQKLEAPTFDQIFRNEALRQEFENLTRRLDAPSS